MNENFANYLQQQTANNHAINLEIMIKKPTEAKGLQVVDCLSWAMFRKYEHKDGSYAEVINTKIVEENGLFL